MRFDLALRGGAWRRLRGRELERFTRRLNRERDAGRICPRCTRLLAPGAKCHQGARPAQEEARCAARLQ